MPTEYRIVEFEQRFELDDDEEVVTAQITESGTRPSSRARNRALIAREPSDNGPYICGAETQSGECQREVDGLNERCWQHED